MTNRHIIKLEGGAELHTRKGWRGPKTFSPGTNRRRKLAPPSYYAAPLSRVNRLWQVARKNTQAAPRWVWSRLKSHYNDWLEQQRVARLKEEARIRQEIADRINEATGAKAGE